MCLGLCQAETPAKEASSPFLSPVPCPWPQDISSQHRYRQRRKAELLRLQATLRGLDAKATFYEEQGDYYSQYLQACLGHLAPGSRSVLPAARPLPDSLGLRLPPSGSHFLPSSARQNSVLGVEGFSG